MRLLLLTAEAPQNNEIALIEQFFDLGLEAVHFRRPHWNLIQCKYWLTQFRPESQQKIRLHQFARLALEGLAGGVHFKGSDQNAENWLNLKQWKQQRPGLKTSLALHGLQGWPQEAAHLDYGFLSPIFPSISKLGYQANWSKAELKKAVQAAPLPLFALGGIRQERLTEVKELGFVGAALLGDVWQSPDPRKTFLELKKVAEGL